MKTLIKQSVAVVCGGLAMLALLCANIDTQAQPPRYGGIIGPVPTLVYSGTGGNFTNSLAASTAFTPTTMPYYSVQGPNVTLQFRFAAAAANSSSIVLGLGGAMEPGLVGTSNLVSLGQISFTANGTTQVTGFTNLTFANGFSGTNYVSPWGAMPYVYVMWISNSAASGALTNYTLKANSW